MTLDRIAWFIGAVARPLGLLFALVCAGISSVILSCKLVPPHDGSMLIGAIWLGATGIFLGKAAEEFGKDRNASKAQSATAKGDTQ